LPLLFYAALRWLFLFVVVFLALLAGFRALPRLLGFLACHVLEQCLLILTWSYLGAWLLYTADGTL
jgi:hypothetical protein